MTFPHRNQAATATPGTPRLPGTFFKLFSNIPCIFVRVRMYVCGSVCNSWISCTAAWRVLPSHHSSPPSVTPFRRPSPSACSSPPTRNAAKSAELFATGAFRYTCNNSPFPTPHPPLAPPPPPAAPLSISPYTSAPDSELHSPHRPTTSATSCAIAPCRRRLGRHHGHHTISPHVRPASSNDFHDVAWPTPCHSAHVRPTSSNDFYDIARPHRPRPTAHRRSAPWPRTF